MTCYACEKAKDRPALKFRGPPGCISCDARALALVYGGMEREQIDPVLRMAWPETKTFRQGRTLFWNWVRAIEESKGATMNTPRKTESEVIQEILDIMEAFGIKLEELEPDKAPARPEETVAVE